MNGRDHYQLLYQNHLDLEAEWLRRGAIEKANSIESLLKTNQLKPQTMLELGCGTGAVITECQRREISNEYTAVDYSEEAISYLASHSSGILATAFDITSPEFSLEGSFDVVILSHVLEHLEEPDDFLKAVHKLSCSYLLVEVPLEGLFFSKVKALIRDRKQNRSGHVQFFTAKSFDQLLTSSGWSILDTRRYVPILDRDNIEFIRFKNRSGRTRQLQQMVTSIYLPTLLRPVWSALYYAHYAVLCKKAADGSPE